VIWLGGQGVGGAPVLSAGDDFTRANGELGTASDGVVWTYDDNWLITGNKAMVQEAAGGSGVGGMTVAYRSNSVVGAHCVINWSEIQIDGEFPGLIFRVIDDTSHHLIYFPNNGAFQVYRLESDVYSSLLFTSAGSLYTPNGLASVVISNNATTGEIIVTINGTAPQSYTDATNKNVAPFGMFVQAPAGSGASIVHFKTVTVSPL
jgi:hypothetical protein